MEYFRAMLLAMTGFVVCFFVACGLLRKCTKRRFLVAAVCLGPLALFIALSVELWKQTVLRNRELSYLIMQPAGLVVNTFWLWINFVYIGWVFAYFYQHSADSQRTIQNEP